MDILDTQARTRERFGRGPFSTQAIGREALRRWVLPLAHHLARTRPPRGLETVIRKLSRRQLAFLALRAILNQIHCGWDLRGKKKRKIANPNALFRLELGRAVRDELEFAGLLGGGKKWVNAAGDKVGRHIRLGKLHKLEWNNRECARVGDWLWGGLSEMSWVDEDERGFPKIAVDHRTALGELSEELVFRYPLYQPSLIEPPPWTAWRTEYDDKIGATFVKTNDPETVETVKAAFASGSIEPHAAGVSAVQRVPLKINPATLPLVREFAGDEYRRDAVVAEALGDKTFWNLIRCDRRGRFIHLCDFNYTRGDPVRSLFLFANGKKVGDSIGWLEIAVANAYGHVKDKTWRGRHEWVAANRELIKVAATSPRLLWLQTGKPEAKEPFAFAAACAEYIAADTHGPEYVTHLPIWLDASSNGLQHLAMMGRDERLAEMVNLNTRTDGTVKFFETPAGEIVTLAYAMDVDFAGEVPLAAREWRQGKVDKTQDVYEIVAARGLTNLSADRDDPLTEFWIDHQHYLRDLLKRPIMTLPYGATKRGMLDQIEEKAEEFGLTLPSGAAAKLRDHVWRAIKEKLPGARRVCEYIQDVAQHCLRRNSFMEWTTPSGLPVANRYLLSRTSPKDRVVLPFLGEKVTIADEYTDKPRRRKTKNSAVANVTHSMDASHLVLSVNAAAAEGIQALTIHDCFGSLAPDVMRFAQIRRTELAHMYQFYCPLTRLRAENIPLGTNDMSPPDFGNLNVFAVTFSEYFDR